MSETPCLGLPLLEAAQAQKHVTHNEALLLLDGQVHLSVVTRALSAPPGAPADGSRYLVGASASGDWSGQSGAVAFREAGAWRFTSPRKGWRMWVEDEQTLLVYMGSVWRDMLAISVLQNMSMLGVNATADTTNRLAVKSTAALFDNTGAGTQLKLNKNAASDTGSLLYQTNYSGRAEMGLTGDDDFHVKVSAAGSSWLEALRINRATGVVSLPNTPSILGYTAENTANKGAANGYAALDGAGKVPSAQLPAYVDDVLEFANLAAFPASGSAGLIYVALDTNKLFRWSGTVYIEISPSPGSTDSVAEGSTNLYFTAARVLAAVLSGLSTATSAAITAADTVLTALGKLQAQITAHVGIGGSAHPAVTTSVAGFMIAADKAKLDGVAAGANLYVHPNHSGDVTSAGDGAQTIAANAVTNSKLAAMPARTLKGNAAAATATAADLTPAQANGLLGVWAGRLAAPLILI